MAYSVLKIGLKGSGGLVVNYKYRQHRPAGRFRCRATPN